MKPASNNMSTIYKKSKKKPVALKLPEIACHSPEKVVPMSPINRIRSKVKPSKSLSTTRVPRAELPLIPSE